MSEDTELHPTLRPDYQIAERVRIKTEVFPRKFRELKEGGQLSSLFRDTRTLTGARMEQAPEVFTEQYLIEPVLHGLGYLNPASEEYEGVGPHFIRRPITYRKVEPRQPDYLLKNVASSLVCIVEAKAANKEQMEGSKRKATDDIRRYLEEDTFCKYLRRLDQRYLVGIGTDGLRWTLWVKDLETSETLSECPKVDIASAVERAAIRLGTIEGELPDGDRRGTERDTLMEEFVPAFAANNLLCHVESCFE